MARETIICLSRLCKQYETDAGAVPVLKDLDIKIKVGEFVAIMGPSGSGKSTLMNILGCLDEPTSGAYQLEGRDVGSLSPDECAELRNSALGFVFQGFNLLQRMNLLDNVALPLLYAGVGMAERNRLAQEMLEKVGLGRHVRSLPSQVSGGQQQRAAIARALVAQPRLILADEPTGNLDVHTGQEIMQLFQQLNAEQGITIVLVTHDRNIAGYARRLVQLVDGQVTHDGAVRHRTLAEISP